MTNPAIDLGFADTFPVFEQTKYRSTENPVDAAIRMAREAFLLDQCDRLENELFDLANDVNAGSPDMHDKARAIIGDRAAA